MIQTGNGLRALRILTVLIVPTLGTVAEGAEVDDAVRGFLDQHCLSCHDPISKKGGLDLEALAFEPDDPAAFARWVAIHDRVEAGEMPPEGEPMPDRADREAFARSLAGDLVGHERARIAAEGRATLRRLNRYEYENVVRDLLHAPWLQLRDTLPEDPESHRFNKIGDALDVSHVQMARYLAAADQALREVMARQVERPPAEVVRYHARDQRNFTSKMKFSQFNNRPERATFPMLGMEAQPEVRMGKAPMTVGQDDPARRDLEAVGVVASTYEPLEVKFNNFEAPESGHFRLRFEAFSVWAGPGKDPKKWHIPDFDAISAGRGPEPVTIYAETPPRLLRHLGSFDVRPEPTIQEIDAWLLAGETIRPDAARLFRSRPPNYVNPLATEEGCPGVAYRWMEVEGPILDEWPPAGHRLLFGDLPLKAGESPGDPIEVVSDDPTADAERLLREFVRAAYRRPVAEDEEVRFLPLILSALDSGGTFADAMIVGYTAVLCSPGFLCLEERPGPLDDFALAARLAFFLRNSAPDDELRRLAAAGELRRPEVLRAQANRLLDAPDSRRFVDAFLDYWLDLRKIVATAPDSRIYPEYYLDDLLTESALEETRQFFQELIRRDLPARSLIDADFAMLNRRLADHYGLPPVEGVAIRRVDLPGDSPRGGLLTQASVLKVTANGTTTSPVLRGAWIMERILGEPPPPPPASVPAVEPDTRGATTIRAQLEKHRTLKTCNACHAKIDPAGFALESFDVLGGWRDRYRALTDEPGAETLPGIGHNGQKLAVQAGPEVDPSGTLPDGRDFDDVRALKRLLLEDEPKVSRNLARQLIVYATGAPIRFADRPEVDRVLERSAAGDHGVRSLILEIVRSDLFRNK